MVLEALPYNYAFLSSPVVDPAYVDAVIAAFFAAIEKSPSLPDVVSLHSLDAECPSYAAMLRELASRGVAPLMLAEDARPFVTREFGVKRSGSTRKKLRQDWKRLTALGAVEVVNDRTPVAPGRPLKRFSRSKKPAGKARRAPRCCPIRATPPLSGGCCKISPRKAMLRWHCCGSTARRLPHRC